MSLTAAQQLAADALATGCRDAEAAERAGVCRETVTRWRSRLPAFRAALEDRRRELWTATVDRLRNLLPKALNAIERALESEDESIRTDAAFRLLKTNGPIPLALPDASTDADSLEMDHLGPDIRYLAMGRR